MRYFDRQRTSKIPRLTLEQVGNGRFPAVFIDDSGSPGQKTSSAYFHSDRKTWVAVIMDFDHVATTYAVLPHAIAGLSQYVGASEFHFAEILSGKKLRTVPYTVRLQAFQLMAEIFAIQRYPILVQTISPDNIQEHEEVLSAIGSVGPFDVRKPSDLGLLLLLWRVSSYFKSHSCEFNARPVLFVDEGRFKAGKAVMMRPLLEFAAHKSIFFRSSTEMTFLQLADFAAFSVNRMQWLLAKENRTPKDDLLLDILLEADFNVINLPKVKIDRAAWQLKDFEQLHIEDRIRKGLHQVLGRKRTSKIN